MAIDRLSSVSALTTADLIPLFSGAIGSDAKATLGLLVTWLQAQLTADTAFTHQYSAPSATGWAVTVAPPADGGNVYLLLTPTAGFAAGTVTLPAAAVHGQEVVAACTQAVTTLTVAGNGNTVNGAPTTLAANGFFRLRYDGVLDTWNRIG